MPTYKYNGETYDIPDGVVADFERDMPDATVAYQVGSDIYDIPLREREGFLQSFPTASLYEEKVKEQAKATDPYQPEIEADQPMYGTMGMSLDGSAPADNLYYPSPLSEEGKADYEPMSAEDRARQEYEMIDAQLRAFDEQNGAFMGEYAEKEKASRWANADPNQTFAVNPNEDYLNANYEQYRGMLEERGELITRRRENSYYQQMLKSRVDESAATADNLSGMQRDLALNNPELEKEIALWRAQAASGAMPRLDKPISQEALDYRATQQDLRAAEKLYREAAEIYAAPSANGEDIFLNFGKGFADPLNEQDFWTMGITKIIDNVNAREAFQKIQDKFGSIKELGSVTEEQIDALLTPSERLLVAAVMDNLQAQMARRDDTSGAYEAGQGAADSAMFMAQFLMLGGLGSAAETAAHKSVVNWLGRQITSINNPILKAVVRETGKTAIGTLESLGKALITTPLMPHTYVNITDKLMSFDDKGELMDATDAVFSGAMDALVETWSESTGAFVERVLGAPGNVVKKGARKFLKDTPFANWGKMMNAPAMRILRRGGFNGFLGEMGEEFIGNAVRSMTGLDPDAFSEFVKMENLFVTAGAFAPMTVLGLGASGAQYGFAKRKLDNAQKAFEGILANMGYTQEQIKFAVDELLATTDAYLTPQRLVEKFTPFLRELQYNDRYAGEKGEAFGAALDFMTAIAGYRTFDGVYHRQQEEQNADMQREIQEGTGREFWTTRLSDKAGLDGTAYEVNEVRAVEFKDGRVAYVLGNDGVNNAVVYNDGQTGFLSEEQIAEEKASGNVVSDATMGLNDYLTQQNARVRMTAEETRMFQERGTNIGQVRAQFPLESTVELGTEEAPVQGVVRQVLGDGVIAESPAGISFLTWEDLGRTIGIEVNPKTDAQMDEEAINNLEIADLQRRRERERRRAERNAQGTTETEAELEAEQAFDEAENEGLENPIPMRADGTVDQTAFWNESPARWAQWKTEQRQDGGAYASTYIQNAINILAGQIAESEAAFLAESDFDAKDALEQTINQQKARLAELQDLAMQYMPTVIPTEATGEAAAETSQAAEVMAERQKFELDKEYQRRLSLAKSLAEKEMILKEYFEAISAGSMEAVVMNKGNYKKLMRENGCTEEQIQEVADAIKVAEERNQAVDALYANGKVFVVAEYNSSVEQGRLSYVHERQHGITKRRPELIQRILSLGLSRETLQNTVKILANGSEFYNDKSDEVLADEILSFTMEKGYTYDNFSVILSRLGLPIELINTLNEINDEQRKDFTLVNARRNENALESGSRTGRQDDRDQEEVSSGVLGQEGVRPAEDSDGRGENGEPAEGAEVNPSDNEGPSFRITPEMDAEYLAAVESGDMNKAQQMVFAAAKIAMPNTKVVDENGNPKVVYHGTGSEFYTFRDTSDSNELGAGYYFSDSYEMAERYATDETLADNRFRAEALAFEIFTDEMGHSEEDYDDNEFINDYNKSYDLAVERLFGNGHVKSVFLNLENPRILSRVSPDFDTTYRYGFNHYNEGVLAKRFNDGVIDEMFSERHEGLTGNQYVAFTPSQIKSADPVTYDDNGNVIPLSERFNPDNNDIRFRTTETNPEDNLSEETIKELADKGLVMDGGVVMSDEYAELKQTLGYETPIERGAGIDDLRFAVVTMPGWKKNYLTYEQADKRIVQILEAFAARITANELVNGVIAKGTHKSSKKTKDGKLVEAGPLRSNISYVVTFDLDTTCPRTFQYLNFVRKIERRIGRPLTQVECIQLNEMMRMYGQQIPCVYCYAENKRQAMKQYFNNYITARHAVLSAETDAEALEHMYGREKEGTDPKTVLTEAAYKVFKKWRKNPKGKYNPTMRILWHQYDQARNSVLSLLDMRYAEGVVNTDGANATIAQFVAGELGITNKTAVREIEEIVVEWKWNTIEGRKHDDYTPVDEDDLYANENALEVWRDMVLYAKSASGAKNVNRYVPYTDELKNVDQATRDYINGMGGLRMHSTNDFRIDYVFDYFQFMADMAAARMFGHTYTKSPEFVRIFGNSGYKINMSIAAYQDENGVIRPNVDEGFDWDEVKELRRLFPNAGAMLMATSDEQLQMALDSDWIDMIIPFHHSGLPKAVWYNMRLWTDYTTVQNESFLNTEERTAMLLEAGVEIPRRASTETIEELFNEHFGIEVQYGKSGKRVKPHFLPGPTIVDGVNIPGHNNDHQRYLELCRQWGVKPRFQGIKVKDNTPEGGGREVDITEHPRYMTLVKETARTDSPQVPIQFNFDQPSEALGGRSAMDYAFDELEARAMAESELAGRKVNDIYTSLNNDQFGIVDQFINTIIKHKQETGEDYPMDYLTPESREWFMVQRKALEEAFKDIATIPYHRNEYDEQGNLVSGPGLNLEEKKVVDIVDEAKKAQKKHDAKAKKGKKSKKDDVRLRVTARTDEQREQLFDKAKQQYGVTNNFNATGYMLPDGSLLDFSESNDGGDPNRRSLDHRDIEGIIMDEGREYDSRYRYIVDFVNEGAIRMLPESAGFQLSVPPTAEQRSRLMDYIYKHNGEVIMEITDENGSNVAYVEYDRRTSPMRIMRDMNGYFNEGIIPEQDVRFRIAYHGSEYDFDKFSLDHGNQGASTRSAFAKPYGIYATDQKDRAMSYSLDRGQGRHLYEVEIPDEGIYDFEGVFSREDKKRILDYIQSERPELYKKAKRAIGVKEGKSGYTISDFLRPVDMKNLGYKGFVKYMHPAFRREGDPLEYVIFDPMDVRIVNHYATKPGEADWFDKNGIEKVSVNFRISNENQAIFVSNAAKAVEAIKQEKATPEQWLKMIEKAGGLKAGEDKWMGLSDWLKASDKKTLTKEEVLDFINENMIVIEEQHYDINAESDAERAYGEISEKLQDRFDHYVDEYYQGKEWDDDYTEDAREYAIEKLREEMGDTFPYTIEREYGSVYLTFPYEEESDLIEWAEKTGVEYAPGINPINDTRLVYTTDGLNNRHEIALTVPTIEPWNQNDEIHFGDAGNGRAIAWIRFGETWERKPSPQISRKVLVIDEIQSKRHQEGREKGYKPDWRGRKKLRENLEKADKEVERLEAEMIKKYGSVDKIVSSEDWDALEAAKEARKEARLEFSNPRYGAVPDAPFEKNWHELAMKRMLRYAAENGYDVIAWTKGEQQAERYGLAKTVKGIEAWDRKPSSKIVQIKPQIGMDILLEVDSEGKIVDAPEYTDYKGKNLSELVGKELAVALMQPGEINIEEDGLKVGGEGMKGFYDKILPAFMNKYGKKWGVKVEDIDLPNLEGGLTMHSVPVTEEMKASVMDGQVMFKITPHKASLDEIENMFYALNKDKALVPIFRKALDFCNEVHADIEFISSVEMAKKEGIKRPIFAALGWAWGNKIRFNADGFNASSAQENAATILHEMLHMATAYVLAQKESYLKKVDADLAKAKEDIDAIFEEVKSKYPMQYGTTDQDEMVAEMSNPSFRKAMKEGNLWERFVNSVRDIIGLEKTDNNRLDATMDALNRILDNPDFVLFDDILQDLAQNSEFVAFRITPEVQEEMDAIKASAIVMGNFMKAPNGKQTSLSEEQWLMVRTQNFKKWFGDWENDPENASKVVDENGEPMVVYHGTAGTINKFEDQQRSPGLWFVDREDVAKGYAESASVEFGEEMNVVPVFLNLRNPRTEDAHGEYPAEFALKSYVENDNGIYQEFDTYEEAEAYRKENVPDGWVGASTVGDQHDLVERARELGHDGVIMKDMHDQAAYAQTRIKGTQTNYVVFDASQIKSATANSGEFSEGEGDIRFSIRTKPAPKNTGIGYKVFYLKDGKLYPPMVANQGGVDTPVGVWLDAEEGTRAGVSKTGRPQVKQGGKGTQGGSGTLAYRPGWHLGEIPYAIQFNRKDENGGRTLFPADFVWAEVEYANDVDYQEEAMSYGMNANGKFQHSLAGLPKLPADGSYRYRTNPNPETDPWIISGAMKVNRILTPTEVDKMVIDAGREPQKRQEGAVTDEQIEALNKDLGLAEEPRFRFSAETADDVDIKAMRGISTLRAFNMGFNGMRKIFYDVAEETEKTIMELRAKQNRTAYDEERLARAEKELQAAHRRIGWWESVNSQLIGTTPYEPDLKEEDMDLEPRNPAEFIAQFLTMHMTRVNKQSVDKDGRATIKKVNKRAGVMLTQETLRRELGWSEKDWSGFRYIISETEGKSLDEIAEMISEDTEAQSIFVGMDVMEIKDAVIDFLQGIGSYAEIRDYIKNERVREAKDYADYVNRRMAEGIERIESGTGMTIEEYNAHIVAEELKEIESILKDIETSNIYGKFEELTSEENEANQKSLLEGARRGVYESDQIISDYGDGAVDSESSSDEGPREDSGRSDSGDVGDRGGEAGRPGTSDLGHKKKGLVQKPLELSSESAPVDEVVSKGRQKAINENVEANAIFSEKMQRLNDSLAKLRAMLAAQREYDANTVKIITGLANELMQIGRLTDMSRSEIKRLLSVIKDATGKEDLSIAVERLMDIMIANQLRSGKSKVAELMKIKASKVNASGVEVRGSLDVAGQQMVQTFKEAVARAMTDEALAENIAIEEENLGSDSEVIRKNAENRLAGYYLARQYREDILASEAEEKALRKEISDAKEQYDAGKMDKTAFKEFQKSCYDAIRENRMQRVTSYERIANQLAAKLAGSILNAKALADSEKARIERIHHYANSDMQGMPSVQQGEVKKGIWNNTILRFLFKPLATFDQMLRSFAPKSRNGEGYLWRFFMGGWMDASEREFKGIQAAHERLDAKVRSMFAGAKRWSDLFSIEKKMPVMKVKFWDGEKMADFALTQGNLLYIYMVNKMTDGKMKLRKMGITEEDVNNIARELDPRFLELADWIQDTFLPGLREKYNALHEKMFGAPMAAIDNYFPIRVLANARTRDVDISVEESSSKPSTITGSIIKRTKNSLALDILGSDAFDVVLEHIEQMEHWAAFAEFNRDLNTLLSYRKFRNRVQNMRGIYGAGTTVWNNFRATAEIAAGVYKPAVKSDSLDKLITNIAKGVTGAKISFRVYTALKQFLSAPAFVSDASAAELIKSLANPYKAWKWAMDELPLFEKRWKSRQAGDSRLMETESDWKLWKTKIVELAGRYGMTPNAFVDALTVSIGAKSIYETKRKEYIKIGYPVWQAEKKAKRDATVLFNESQQSNESAFLSAAQVDRTVASILITVFRNSSMGYQRMYVDALRNIKNALRKGYKAESLEYMTKLMVRDGLTQEQAERAANRIYNRSFARNAVRLATFGFLVQFAWNLGPYMAYLLMGDDDDEKKDMIKDAAVRGLVGGPVEGLAAGQAISSVLGDVAMKEAVDDPMLKLPAASDMEAIFNQLDKDPVRAVNDIFNLVIQSGIGVNPQTISDAVVAIIDGCNGDMETSKEAAFALMRILQTPQSQIEKLYMEEIDFTAEEALDMNVREFAERYAKYKIMRTAPLTKWAYSDEKEKELEERYIKTFTKKASEMERTHGTEEAQKFYEYYDTEYEEVPETLRELKQDLKDARKDKDDEEIERIKTDIDSLLKSEEFKRFDKALPYIRTYEKWKKALGETDDPEKREQLARKMIDARNRAVQSLEETEND